ncbi:hypothetical protein H2203_001764 [Taxawa tesnikishii (nom. ined.)]|nr:hypothetical protein H2203_001764 [Dothideales sp. JES 119]
MKNVDLMKGAHKDPSYIAHKHPFARVPVLEDGDLTIFESRAICRYLLSKYAGDGNELRLPQDPSALAVFEQTASVEYSYFSPAITDIAYEKLFKR